jgi:hypothetical protein
MGDQAQTDSMAEFSGAARTAIAAYRNLLDKLPSDHPNVANMKDGLACWELGLEFYGEANRAVQAEVWFAAAAVAAAALEAMLLAKMFASTEAVAQLASFKKLIERHHGDFGSFPKRDGSGETPRNGQRACMVPTRRRSNFLTKMLSYYIDQDALTTLTGMFTGSPSAGYTSADLLRQYRSLLHPAYCLRQDICPTRDTGIRATFFCLVAYASLGSI